MQTGIDREGRGMGALMVVEHYLLEYWISLFYKPVEGLEVFKIEASAYRPCSNRSAFDNISLLTSINILDSMVMELFTSHFMSSIEVPYPIKDDSM